MVKLPKTAPEPLKRSPSHLLHLALQYALDVYAKEVGENAVTQRQYAVLCAVAENEGASQIDLVRATGIDRSTLAQLVSRMIGKGLLARERSTTDSRVNAVHLSPAGRAALDGAATKVVEADQRVLHAIGRSRRDAFMTALRELARAGRAGEDEPVVLSPEAVAEAEAKAARKKAKKAAKKAKKTKPVTAEVPEPSEP